MHPLSERRTVTVFGGTGFLGRRVVDRLLGRDFTARIAARHPNRGDRIINGGRLEATRAVGRFGTRQGDQLGFLLAVKDRRHRRCRALLAAQHRLKALFHPLLAHPVDHRNTGIQSIDDLAVAPPLAGRRNICFQQDASFQEPPRRTFSFPYQAFQPLVFFFYAVDLLEIDGKDLRYEPWEVRRETLRSQLRRARPGLRFSEHLNGSDGATAFRHACLMGLEGIVAKRRDRPYKSGRSADWVKVKNPNAPAATRIMEW